MQHEILFRAKRIDNGEWVEGWYCKYAFCGWPLGECIIPASEAENGCLEHVEVDPNTIGWFTGLLDQNGARIFEGDIIHGKVIGDIWAGEIVWIDCIAGFGVRYAHRTDPTAWENSSILKQLLRYREDEFSAEVIGNIHDNLELLEAGNKETARVIEKLVEERDAAVSMLRGECFACKHNQGWRNVGKCMYCAHETAHPVLPVEQREDNWEWKGAKE